MNVQNLLHDGKWKMGGRWKMEDERWEDDE
jgi:hypothetical protein